MVGKSFLGNKRDGINALERAAERVELVHGRQRVVAAARRVVARGGGDGRGREQAEAGEGLEGDGLHVEEEVGADRRAAPVSYTHLTLPTKA